MVQKKYQILLIGFVLFFTTVTSIGYASSDLDISIELPRENRVIKNRPFELNILAQWDGEPYDYLILPPSFNLPDIFSVIDTTTQTKALSGEKQQIIFKLQICVSDIGEYKLDSLKLEYIPKDDGDKFTKSLPIITLRVVAWNIWGLTLIHLAIIFCVAFLFLIAGYLILRRKKNRAKQKILESQEREIEKQLDNLLEKARQAKVSGNSIEFLEIVILLKRKLEIKFDNEDGLLEGVKYAGHKISKEKIEYLYRDIEHVLKIRRK